ncbi:unnamed protein product [Adineta ricciae]|uniref:Uncharacterized protein n=1 Tax=Adineta ricciae TaxID=249248 RepID=A0A813P752_ADIRI|nr:unnamed protein product [Adineta ricciae]CAF0937419.1 unnamed protein product [Adineta ricciae]
MASDIFQKDILLSVPCCIESFDLDQRSRSGSTVSNCSSIIDEDWAPLTGRSSETEKNETLSSTMDADIIAQVYSNIVQVPWQDELAIGCNQNENLHICLGISPSQFRRLLPSKRDAAQTFPRVAILYAYMALKYTLEQINQTKTNDSSKSLVVLIVDAIQKYNFAVFNNKLLSTGTALKYALEEGDRLADVFEQARRQLEPELAQCVTVIRWHDICTDKYKEYVEIFRRHTMDNEQFAELVEDVVKIFIKVRKPTNHFTAEQHLTLQEYVFNELPALTQGIVYDNHHYRIIAHPVLSSDDKKNDDQRNVMLRLLNYIRNSTELAQNLDLIEKVHMCDVYDIVMPAFKPFNLYTK